MKVTVDGLDEAMMSIVKTYTEDVEKASDEAQLEAAKETVSRLKVTSPKGPDGYAASWSRKKRKGSQIVYNKEHYQLTHLLENGHVIKNKYGTYGRTNPNHHISDAEEIGNRSYLEKVKAKL